MDHALYFVASADPNAARAAEQAFAEAPSAGVRVFVETSIPRTLARLRSGVADALVIDGRGAVVADDPRNTVVGALLRELFGDATPSPIGRSQTWMVAAGDEHGVWLAHQAGLSHLAQTIVAPPGAEGYARVRDVLEAAAQRRSTGGVALCLAGGGIEGLFYELGVLRALSDFLPGRRFADFSLLTGISAGAIVTSLLANGLSPRDVLNGLSQGEGRLERITRGDLFDPNAGELLKRLAVLPAAVAKRKISPLSALFRLPPSGVFAGDRLRAYLRRQLNGPGMTDDFRRLSTKLLIGATDQDSGEHVVFGEEGRDQIPIHQAVRASCALVPFYAPEVIEGRSYVDGGFTRTTNMRVAIQRGANLVILVDPMVPIVADTPGHVAARGGVYAAVQGLKSLMQSRFDKALNTLREMYPDVSFHLFQPQRDAQRVMAGSPMKFFYRREVENIAYAETMRQLRGAKGEALGRDFASRGILFAEKPRPSQKLIEDDDVPISSAVVS